MKESEKTMDELTKEMKSHADDNKRHLLMIWNLLDAIEGLPINVLKAFNPESPWDKYWSKLNMTYLEGRSKYGYKTTDSVRLTGKVK